MDICGTQAVYIPLARCDDCSTLVDRVAALEAKLNGKSDIVLSKTDTAGSISVTVIGSASEG